MQALLVERRGVITFYEDLAFTDERLAAMQWLGARGFGKGYRADVSNALTRAEAADRVMRVLAHEGKRWVEPAGDGELHEAEVIGWLRKAGYPRDVAAAVRSPLDVGGLARILYAMMRPLTV